MRYLGIDYGDKRIGTAISDEEGKFAFPKLVISRPRRALPLAGGTLSVVIEKLNTLIQENKIKTIVVGLPQNFKGEDTQQTKKVRVFAEKLTKELGVEIVFENEILTSKQVDKNGGATKEMQDAAAAALILQGYLDRKNKDFCVTM
ncbi:hypothetical protein A3J56_00970 [Candidatus Giovannonibacteria bacterium RIFCSPHIGHO2_02_FULL_46_20]|uniref:Putative pre-16S rRNA nuclease n=1 Tax=Candidatus Giovannonibacteria bacterium RIFCSPHIGHO2_02_FULL_46_20 TaxID=1798338 RepID=A0A1F5WFT3_9BACT|nr:MAG: hypothetical protein A3J56_00970 [Candidatus Giovannonibacteria bacterium RIFCSPHIGHO2_02_FULL_46_20]